MFFIKLLIVALLHGRHHSLFHRHFFQNIEGNFLWIWWFHAGTKRSFLIETFKMNNKKERIIWSLKTNIELSMNNIIDQSIPGLYNLNSEHSKTLLPSKNKWIVPISNNTSHHNTHVNDTTLCVKWLSTTLPLIVGLYCLVRFMTWLSWYRQILRRQSQGRWLRQQELMLPTGLIRLPESPESKLMYIQVSNNFIVPTVSTFTLRLTMK